MIIPCLNFSGNCLEAIAFYENAFNSKIKMCQLYGDYIPEGIANIPGNLSEWILHAEMEICGNTVWLADDVQKTSALGNNMKLTVTIPTKKEASDIFLKLSDGADIHLPPTDTFYSSFHAGLVDKYGNSWDIVAEEAPGLQ